MTEHTTQQDITQSEIKIHPGLGRVVLLHDLGLVYRVWLVLRSADVNGSGVVGRETARQALQAHGLTARHLITARRQSGSEKWFTVFPNRIEYRSLESVCVDFGVEPGRPVVVDAGVVGNLQEFRAVVYAAWFVKVDGDERTISRDTLTELFGVSHETQRRWERLAGIDVTANLGSCAVDELGKAQAIIPVDNRLDGLDRLGRSYIFERVTDDGQVVLYWRTVNSYRADLALGRVGKSRKVTRRVRKGGQTTGAATLRRIFVTKTNTPKKPFYTPGHTMRETDRTIYTKPRPTSPDGVFSVWAWSPWRPVTRLQAVFS